MLGLIFGYPAGLALGYLKSKIKEKAVSEKFEGEVKIEHPKGVGDHIKDLFDENMRLKSRVAEAEAILKLIDDGGYTSMAQERVEKWRQNGKD